MQAIARAVGLSKATLCWHFSSKEELFRSVYQDFAGEMMRPLEHVLDGLGSPEVKLHDIAEKSLALAQEHADSLRVLLQFTAEAELADTAVRFCAVETARWVETLAPLFAALGDPYPSTTARLFAEMLDGLMCHILVNPDMVRETDFLSAITRCLLLPRLPV